MKSNKKVRGIVSKKEILKIKKDKDKKEEDISKMQKIISKTQKKKFKKQYKKEKQKTDEKISEMSRRKRMTFWMGATCLILGAFIFRIGWIQFVMGEELQAKAYTQQTLDRSINPKRGTIYDVESNVLAHNVTSYTLIAYLDPNRSNKKQINHVKDIESTAKALAPILNADEKKLKDPLEKGKKEKKYQIELGNAGKNITEMKKSEIEKLNLPGIDFTENYKRYYPNGDFASYILGYAKTNESKDKNGKLLTSIDGELGIEAKFDEILKGTDGYLQYQQDRFGYKIPDTKETRIDALDGSNIYLTLDSNIQRFVETEVKAIEE